MGLTDESLLAGLVANDADAATAFIRRFQGRVFGLAFTILYDRDAATEVAQEAFVRAWRYGAGFDPRRGTVAAWLLTITRNLAVDAARVRRNVPVDPAVFSSLPLVSVEPEPGDDLRSERELAELRQALAALPEEQRRCLLLAVFRGMTAREISELDGIPLGTVKTRIRASMTKLRSALGVHHD